MEFNPKVVDIAEKIRDMTIRGAGKIARAAAECLIIVARESKARTSDEFWRELIETARFVNSTRPTAVSLPNALRYVLIRTYKGYVEGNSVDDLREIVIMSGEEFIKNSLAAVERIGEIGSRRISDGDVILTHCHSTAALNILLHAHKQGKRFKVFSTETRPKFQGRITSRILAENGIPVTLIVDSAARFVMDKVDKVVVGSDAIAANGAVVNKIGTSQIALAAYEARVRVMVAAETYKFSPETLIGRLIKIELRPETEVVDKEYTEKYGVSVLNPAFDITPPEYVDIIVTEKGIIPPQAAILVLRREFGWFTNLSKELL